MASRSLPQRLARAVAKSPVSERIARAQEVAYGPVLERVHNGPLRTDVLGHSVHPPLTDITLGCWLSTSILDLVGGQEARRAATVLTGAGVLAAVPTAFAGAGDWTWLSGDERRVGAVHALGTDVATLLFVGSLVARLRGRHRTATKLALAGNVVVAGAGFLGGHLALQRGTARRVPVADRP